ncbi:MAG: hypothetical protein ACHQ50_05755 [Fimbriimonadales bacterium]
MPYSRSKRDPKPRTIFRELIVALVVIGVNLTCWRLTIAWADHVNDYVWGKPGHPGMPGPPPWLPVSRDAYCYVNLYLSLTCMATGVLGGLLLLRTRITAAIIVASLGIASGCILAFLSMVATF